MVAVAWAALGLGLGPGPVLGPTAAGARVVLVGVDGGSWSVIDPLIAEGALPHLAAIARRGVTAELATVEPLISPVVWTSIATGRSPEAHGISDFMKTGLDRRVPTIFERLAARGRRVGLYEYLLTWPARELPEGFVVPGWLRRDERVTPASLAAKVAYRYDLRGLRNREEYRENAREEIARKAGQWNRLAEDHDLEVGAVTFYAVDALSHRYWNEPAVIRETVLGVDGAIGEIVEALGPEDTILVASDHGFQAGSRRRVWSGTLEGALSDAGLVPMRDAFTILGQFGVVVLRVNAGPFAEREALLERLRAVLEGASDAAGEPVFTVDVLDEAERPPGAQRGILTRLRQWGLRRFARWRFNAHFDPDAHAYVIAQFEGDVLEGLLPDGEIRFGGKRHAMRDLISADEFTGDHHPTAIFLAAGRGVRAVPERGALSVLDVAPLIAALAGEPVPDDVEGRVPEEWLTAEFLAAHPVRRVAASAWPELPTLAETELPVDDADLLERLRTMGYVR